MKCRSNYFTCCCNFLNTGGVALASVSEEMVRSNRGVSEESAISEPASLGSAASPACLHK